MSHFLTTLFLIVALCFGNVCAAASDNDRIDQSYKHLCTSLLGKEAGMNQLSALILKEPLSDGRTQLTYFEAGAMIIDHFNVATGNSPSAESRDDLIIVYKAALEMGALNRFRTSNFLVELPLGTVEATNLWLSAIPRTIVSKAESSNLSLNLTLAGENLFYNASLFTFLNEFGYSDLAEYHANEVIYNLAILISLAQSNLGIDQRNTRNFMRTTLGILSAKIMKTALSLQTQQNSLAVIFSKIRDLKDPNQVAKIQFAYQDRPRPRSTVSGLSLMLTGGIGGFGALGIAEAITKASDYLQTNSGLIDPSEGWIGPIIRVTVAACGAGVAVAAKLKRLKEFDGETKVCSDYSSLIQVAEEIELQTVRSASGSN